MKTLTSITLISLLTLNFIFIGCGEKKDDTQTKKDEKTTTQNQTTQTQPPTTAAAPKIGKVWESIQKKNDELNKTIASKKLAGVHEIAFSIRDLVKTLPAQSTGFSSDKKASLDKDVKEISDLAEQLDKYGDANDFKNTSETYTTFVKALDSIKSLYPEESFK